MPSFKSPLHIRLCVPSLSDQKNIRTPKPKSQFLCNCCNDPGASIEPQNFWGGATICLKEAERRKNHCYGGSRDAVKWNTVVASNRNARLQRRHRGGTRAAEASPGLRDEVRNIPFTQTLRLCSSLMRPYPDSKDHGAHMGPISVRQDPGGPHVGHMNFAIWVTLTISQMETQGRPNGYHCRSTMVYGIFEHGHGRYNVLNVLETVA